MRQEGQQEKIPCWGKEEVDPVYVLHQKPALRGLVTGSFQKSPVESQRGNERAHNGGGYKPQDKATDSGRDVFHSLTLLSSSTAYPKTIGGV